jgi:predicted RNA-binding protein YlqC (UPF0109 family)
MDGMKDLVEFMAKSLVDSPEEVEVTEERDGDRLVLHLQVAEPDMGKVIGKQGRIAQAMRTLLKVAAVRRGRSCSPSAACPSTAFPATRARS